MSLSASGIRGWAVGLLLWAVGLPACSGGNTTHGSRGGNGGASAGGAPANGGSPDGVAEAGEAGQDAGCVPSSAKCLPSFECGTVDDGCGKDVECGSCAGDRLCSGHECVEQCVGCVVGSTCIGDGGSQPDQPCLACDAASGKLVARAEGVCDDGDACTTSDRCDAGRCAGVAKACVDGVACNGAEACDPQSGQCVAGSPTCQTGVCDLALDTCVTVCKGCNIGQVCYQSGAVNPANPCEACNAETNATGWTVTPGVSCGANEVCQFNHVCTANGQCQFDTAKAGQPCPGANPNTTCAAYACDGLGSCAVQLADTSTACGVSKPCQKQDHCDGVGSCEAGGPLALGTVCKEYATCSGAANSPTCECVQGAQPSGAACVDVNECNSNTDNCDSKPDACINDVLGFHCACPGNFIGAGVGEDACSCNHAAWSPLCEPWSQVALQDTHACALSAGALFCWGKNDSGQLGTGDLTARYRPSRIGSFADWDFVAVGYAQSCGIRAGALYCWGDNGADQLGIGGADSKVPQRVGTASDWTFVAAGIGTQCGIRTGGALYCWGWNGHGQLGLGYTSNFVTTPTLLPTLSGTTTVSLETDSVCAVAAGKLYCWGGNSSGELGTDPVSGDVMSPTRVTQFEDFVDVDAGVLTSCATRADGTLYCWGWPYEVTPTQVGTATQWQSVSSGSHRCALTQDGSAYCWGPNTDGAIGDGTSAIRTLPTEVAGGQHWEEIVAGRVTSCGIHDGGLYCWGSNEGGIRGTGFNADLVGSDSDWATVTAGIGYSCALKTTGQLYCWGGYPGSVDRPSPWVPTLIGQASDHDWTLIDSGVLSVCGIKAGDAYCWGFNGDGQVGNGQKTDVLTPTRVGNAGLWQQLSVGEAHTCGIRDANLYCWGRDDSGQVGNGSLPAPTVPELVASGGWTNVATGSKHSCAIKAGALYCWGDDSQGQIGNGGALSTSSYNTPVRVGSTNDWLAVSAGYTQSCGIQQGGVLSCWGAGQSAPIVVPGSKPWRAADARGYDTCALQTDNKLYCWGLNQHGQLGTGDAVHTTSPVPAIAASTFNNVSVEGEHVCGVTTLGGIRCWGENQKGALGRSEGLLPMIVLDPTLN